jgi:phage terminase large subunit
MNVETKSGTERFIYEYHAYDHQKAFHESRLTYRLLGGAAGPGKTLALIEDHMLNCNQFSLQDAPQVHTLILRRTHPKLESTVITRFREKIPKELYREYNEQKHIVTWLNGSTTQFGSMQYEHDVWGWQGQWYKIAYDELTEFTFSQWQNISAWNRCPVSKRSTKDGATNPIGIGARWVEDLFVKKRPCAEMDANQKAQYLPTNYGYFPATYLANPIYANDPQYIANLDSYQAAVSKALKHGIWGVAGGYFDGAWDEAYNVYAEGSVQFESWWKKWLGGDWGFDHNSVIHWFCLDDYGIVRIYRELVCNKHTPEELAERIVKMSGNEQYAMFSFSHDAFAQRQDVNPIGLRIGAVLRKAGVVEPTQSTKDKIGREQILYDYLKGRVRIGQIYNDQTGSTEAMIAAKLQISDSCENLIRTIPGAPRDEKNSETIAEFLGDDSLQSSGYGLYAMFGKPAPKPLEVRIEERFQHIQQVEPQATITQLMMARARIQAEEQERIPRPMRMKRRWRFRGV